MDTENMAAIEIQQNLLKVNTFLEFMADLGTKKANKDERRTRLLGSLLEDISLRLETLQGLPAWKNETFHCSTHLRLE